MRAEKIVEARQRELYARSDGDQSHEPCRRVVQKAASCARPVVGHKHHNEPHDDRGYHDRDECRDRQRQLQFGKRPIDTKN